MVQRIAVNAIRYRSKSQKFTIKTFFTAADFAALTTGSAIAQETIGSVVGTSTNANYPIAVQGSNGVLCSCTGTRPRLKCVQAGGGTFSSAGLSCGALVGIGLVSIAVVGAIASSSDDAPETNGTN